MTTTERAPLVSAHVEVGRGSVDTAAQRDDVRRWLLPTLFEAAINAGGVGIRDVTDVKVSEQHERGRLIYQAIENRKADEEGREPIHFPFVDIAAIDATVVWPDA